MMRFFRFFAPLLALLAMMPAAHAGRAVLINSDAFFDPQNGIPALVSAMNQLNNEFKPTSNELAMMNTKVGIEERALATAIQANDSAAATEHETKLRQLQMDIKRKSGDASALVEQRRKVLVGPVEDKVDKAMAVYAAAKGIDVVLDANTNPLYASQTWAASNDVTADFIAWYKAQPAE